MDNDIALILPRVAIFQILDALYQRLEIWQYTEEYLETGLVREPYCIEECSNPEEAHLIAEHYCEIIQSIENQTGIPAQNSN